MKELLKITLDNDGNVNMHLRITNRVEYDAISDALYKIVADFMGKYEGNLGKGPIALHPALAIIEAMGLAMVRNKGFQEDFYALLERYRKEQEKDRPEAAEPQPNHIVVPPCLNKPGPKS